MLLFYFGMVTIVTFILCESNYFFLKSILLFYSNILLKVCTSCDQYPYFTCSWGFESFEVKPYANSYPMFS